VEASVLTSAGHITQILLLAVFIFLLFARDRARVLRDRFAWVLGGLAIVALLAHLDFFTSGHFHIHEFYNYYVGTKYFPELGYTGLYEATVVADHEDDPASYDPDQGVRSLVTYRLEPRRASVGRAAAIRARFSPERWAEFKSDIAYFRETDGVLWRMGESLRDHGYNGSPLVTAILGGLARQPFLSTPTYIRLAAWFDIALVVLAGAIVALWIGPEAGLLFLFLWAVNPFNDHAYVGGAYLRYMSLIALFFALLARTKGRLILSGAAFAVATLLRGFPGLLIAGLLAQNLFSADRRRLLRRHAPLFASAAVTALILVGATSLIRSPGGGNPWAGFAQKISLHSDRLSPNVLGLRYLFFYSDEYNVTEILRSWEDGRNLNWIVEAHRTIDARRGYYLGVMTALALALLILLHRGRPEDGLFAGIVLVFAWLHLAHYYYFILALVPFIYARRRDGVVPLAVFWMAVAAACLLPQTVAVLDFRFYVLSVLMCLYFAATLTLRALSMRRLPPEGR
jgi:hypothetical protein